MLQRLCRADGNVSESCFLQTVMKFSGNTSWIQYAPQQIYSAFEVNLPRVEIPRVTVTEGVHPPGSEWARLPIPFCRVCDQSVCGEPIDPDVNETFQPGASYGYGNETFEGGLAWFKQMVCAQQCSGLNLTVCPPGLVQFPEPASGLSGYTGFYGTHVDGGDDGFPFSIFDTVVVPEVEEGDYLLSWRWVGVIPAWHLFTCSFAPACPSRLPPSFFAGLRAEPPNLGKSTSFGRTPLSHWYSLFSKQNCADVHISTAAEGARS